MSDNWVVQNLENALNTWNEKLAEIWQLVTQSPENFKGGTIWQTIQTVNGAMQGIGYGLLVLFLAVGIFRSSASFRDFQRPEHVLRHFIYFVMAKLAVTYGIDLMVDIFAVCAGIISAAAGSVGGIDGAAVSLPAEMATAIEDVGFLASITLVLGLPFLLLLGVVPLQDTHRRAGHGVLLPRFRLLHGGTGLDVTHFAPPAWWSSGGTAPCRGAAH